MTLSFLGPQSSLPNRMLRVFFRRIFAVIPVLIGVTIATFLLVRMLPGGPAQTLVGVRASPQVVAEVNRQLGLKHSLPSQYGHYLWAVARGHLGHSILTETSVNAIITSHLGVTIELIVYAVMLALTIGVPLAALAAHRRGSWPDNAVRGVVVVTLGLPSFWIGAILISFAGLKYGWLPSGGSGTGLVGRVDHLFLPALTLAFTFLAVLVRSLRASISEILRADFVDAARLKGLRQRRLLTHHVLRIALMPVVTLIGLNMSFLLGASVIVENVFAVDGIGQQLVSAVLQRDFLVVQGITFVFGIIVLVISICVDLTQAALDPRVAT